MRSKTLEHADYFVLYITCGLFCFTCGLCFFYLLLADLVQPGTRHADYSVLPRGLECSELSHQGSELTLFFLLSMLSEYCYPFPCTWDRSNLFLFLLDLQIPKFPYPKTWPKSSSDIVSWALVGFRCISIRFSHMLQQRYHYPIPCNHHDVNYDLSHNYRACIYVEWDS